MLRTMALKGQSSPPSLEMATMMIVIMWFGSFPMSRVAAENGQYSFVANASTAQLQTEYDYIIVGGGTAGCPLAATLSQKYKVLLLERGGAPYDSPDVQNEGNFAQVLSGMDDQFSPTQGFQSEEGVLNRRARILGGGSSVNAGFYSRAEPSWVSDRRLDLAQVNHSYEWVEKTVTTFPTMLGPWQTAVRDALLEVGITPYNGMSYDHLYGTKIGGTIFDSLGHRHTAADLLQHANPQNIQVLLYATVHQILTSVDGRNGCPKATGVVYSDEVGSRHQAVTSAKTIAEVILTAGAIGSPQLLMLSGIGPADHLRDFDIPVILDQPAVGEQMADNPTVTMLIPSMEPVEDSLISAVGILSTDFFIEASSGASTSFGEMRSLNVLTPDYRNKDAVVSFSTTLPNFPPEALRIIGQAGVLLGKVAKPISRGSLKLNSTNIRDNPSVRFNYFTRTQDLYCCVEGVRVMLQLVRSKAMENITYPELPGATLNWAGYVGPLAPETTEVDLLSQWCRDTVLTIWHFHGGCQEGVVVDSDYKVLGVESLRVIDGSTFNSSPGTNPQATVMMLGRYMGLKILKENES